MGSQCLAQCPDGTFAEPASPTNLCTVCGTGCATCNNNANTCYSCLSGYYKNLDQNVCINAGCPVGQYKDDDNSPRVCMRCNATCAACDKDVCTSCKTGFYLDINNIHCVSGCALG
jgi:hypothetical protein